MVTKAVLSAHYGMREIRELYSRYFSISLMIAITLHALAIGGAYLVQLVQGNEKIARSSAVVVFDFPHLNPSSNVITGVKINPRSIKHEGVPVPVPIPIIITEPEKPIPRTSGPGNSSDSSPGKDGGVTEYPGSTPGDIIIDEDPDPGKFYPIEKPPVPVKEIVPEYPEIARRLSIEGSVWVNILIGKDGKPKKTLITKSENDLFNENAQKAAMQMLFTPALMNNGPVAIWVTVPFKFRLNK